MTKVKAVCKNCDSAIKYAWWENVLRFISAIFISFGIIFVFCLIIIGPVKLINTASTSVLTKDASLNTEELRHIALNYTTYEGFNAFHFADNLMENMPRMRYALNSFDSILQNVNETMNYGGDCKAQSTVFAGLMMSVGYEAFVDCSIEQHHCVVKIPYQAFDSDYELYMIVDPTISTTYIYHTNADHWDDKEESLLTRTYEKENEDA